MLEGSGGTWVMPFELPLGQPWKGEGWKVKIRDKERLEPPHVTILRGTRAWRLGLRDGKFMDADPPPRDVFQGVLDEVKRNWRQLIEEWDKLYPENPVSSSLEESK